VDQNINMLKKRILLLSDDLRMTSGIATMSKEFVLGTLHKYDWLQLGSGINHPEVGSVVDINEDVRKRTGIKDADLKIIPNNGYGDIHTLRKLLKEERIDAILHFTDPHYWQWLYENEHEIRQQVPILYYHIWDNLPDPFYNRNFYESCDWLGCISKQTYGIVHRVGKSKKELTFKPLEDWQISYVPHGINQDTFKPLEDKELIDVKKDLFGDKEYDFVLFFNSRNIRRKQPSDVINSFKLFCDKLPKEKSKRCVLLMHTTPIDNNGTDLYAVRDKICPNYDVIFSQSKIESDVLNKLYNLADCTINIANNEGFGLGTAESIMAGTPIIVNVTGGLQDQCGFPFTENDYINIETLHSKKDYETIPYGEWVIPIWSSAINLNGSPLTPYLYDDRVNNNDVADTIMEMYNWSKEERKERGLKGREWAIKNLSSKIMCDKMCDGINKTIKNFTPRERFNLYKVI
jgi:glycosyltransferase involved in cell wall biosynthesis